MSIVATQSASSSTVPAATLDEIWLDSATRRRLHDRLIEVPVPDLQADELTARLHQIFAELPLSIMQSILDAGRHPDTAGVTLISNLPVDPQLPPTPVNGGPATDKQTFISEGVMLGLSSLIGEPFGVRSEKAGQLVHDVVPVMSGSTTQTNQGSATFLNFHNDIVYDDSGIYTLANPDFLVLGCLRSDPEGQALTYYADARDLVNRLHPEHLETLRQPQYQLNAPGSYCRDVGRSEVLSEVTSIVQGPLEFPEISISANGVQALTTSGANALAALQVACREVGHSVALRPGQALLINNRKGLHARSSFPAHYDGNDRWLQRTYVRRSLWEARYRLESGSRRVF